MQGMALAMGLERAAPPRRIAEESQSLDLQRIILVAFNGYFSSVGISRDLHEHRSSEALVGTAFPKWSLE